MDFVTLITEIKNSDQARDLQGRVLSLVNLYRGLDAEFNPDALSFWDNTRNEFTVRSVLSDVSEADVSLSDFQNGLYSFVNRFTHDHSETSYLNLCSLNLVLCRLVSSQEQYLVIRERFFGAESMIGSNDLECSLARDLYSMKDECAVTSRKYKSIIGLDIAVARVVFAENFPIYHSLGRKSGSFYRYLSSIFLNKIESYRVARGPYYQKLHRDGCILSSISHWVGQPSLSCHLRITQLFVGQYLETYEDFVNHRLHGDNLARCYGNGMDLLKTASETSANIGHLCQEAVVAIQSNTAPTTDMQEYFSEMLVAYDSFYAGCLLLGHISEFLAGSPYRHIRVDKAKLTGELIEICNGLQVLVRFPEAHGALQAIPDETFRRFYERSHNFLGAELGLIRDRVPKLKKLIRDGFPDGEVEIAFPQAAEYWWVVLPYYDSVIQILSQFSFVFLELSRRCEDYTEVRRLRVMDRFNLFNIFMSPYMDVFGSFYDEMLAGRENYRRLENNTRLHLEPAFNPRVIIEPAANTQENQENLIGTGSVVLSPASAANISRSSHGSSVVVLGEVVENENSGGDNESMEVDEN